MKYNRISINFNLIWKGSNAMFHDMDGIKKLTDKIIMNDVPEGATLFMFKVDSTGTCYLGVPYNEELARVKHFTHIGWKTFSSKEEQKNAIANIRWMYRTIPNHPGRRYI